MLVSVLTRGVDLPPWVRDEADWVSRPGVERVVVESSQVKSSHCASGDLEKG
jgi:hypothetical protein